MALLKYKNLLSLDSVYWFYRGLGEPLPARKLLTNIFVPSEDIQQENKVKNCTNHNLIHGKILLHLTISPQKNSGIFNFNILR